MTEQQDLFRRMRETLAAIFPSRGSAKLLALDARLAEEALDLDGSPRNFWQNILEEAERQGKVDALLELALKQAPARAELADLRDEHQHWQAALRLPTIDNRGRQESPRRASTAVLFDEAHGQGDWWGIAPTIDKGYRRLQGAAEFLPAGDKLSSARLRGFKALVLPIGPHRATQLAPAEIQSVQDFVRAGGGLLVLGTYTGDWHHEANLNQLLQKYGIALKNDVVMPPGTQSEDCFRQGRERAPGSTCAVGALPVPGGGQPGAATAEPALLKGITRTVTLSSCSLYVNPSLATAILASPPESEVWEPVPEGQGIYIQEYVRRSQGRADLVARSNTSKVVVAGSWKMFLDAFVDYAGYENGQLYRNIIEWLTAA